MHVPHNTKLENPTLEQNSFLTNSMPSSTSGSTSGSAGILKRRPLRKCYIRKHGIRRLCPEAIEDDIREGMRGDGIDLGARSRFGGWPNTATVTKKQMAEACGVRIMPDLYDFLNFRMIMEPEELPSPRTLGTDTFDTKSDNAEWLHIAQDNPEYQEAASLKSEPCLTQAMFANRKESKAEMGQFLGGKTRKKKLDFVPTVERYDVEKVYETGDFYNSELNEDRFTMQSTDDGGGLSPVEMTKEELIELGIFEPFVIRKHDTFVDSSTSMASMISTASSAMRSSSTDGEGSNSQSNSGADSTPEESTEPASQKIFTSSLTVQLSCNNRYRRFFCEPIAYAETDVAHSVVVKNAGDPETVVGTRYCDDPECPFRTPVSEVTTTKTWVVGSETANMEEKPENHRKTAGMESPNESGLVFKSTAHRFAYAEGHGEKIEVESSKNISENPPRAPRLTKAGSKWLDWTDQLTFDCCYTPVNDETFENGQLASSKAVRRITANAEIRTSLGRSLPMHISSTAGVHRTYKNPKHEAAKKAENKIRADPPPVETGDAGNINSWRRILSSTLGAGPDPWCLENDILEALDAENGFESSKIEDDHREIEETVRRLLGEPKDNFEPKATLLSENKPKQYVQGKDAGSVNDRSINCEQHGMTNFSDKCECICRHVEAMFEPSYTMSDGSSWQTTEASDHEMCNLSSVICSVGNSACENDKITQTLSVTDSACFDLPGEVSKRNLSNINGSPFDFMFSTTHDTEEMTLVSCFVNGREKMTNIESFDDRSLADIQRDYPATCRGFLGVSKCSQCASENTEQPCNCRMFLKNPNASSSRSTSKNSRNSTGPAIRQAPMNFTPNSPKSSSFISIEVEPVPWICNNRQEPHEMTKQEELAFYKKRSPRKNCARSNCTLGDVNSSIFDSSARE